MSDALTAALAGLAEAKRGVSLARTAALAKLAEARREVWRTKNAPIISAAQAVPAPSLDAIALNFGLTRERIRQVLKQAGVKKIRARGSWRKPDPIVTAKNARRAEDIAERAAARAGVRAEALAMRQRGLTYIEIGRIQGIAPVSALLRVRQAGWERGQ